VKHHTEGGVLDIACEVAIGFLKMHFRIPSASTLRHQYQYLTNEVKKPRAHIRTALTSNGGVLGISENMQSRDW